MAGRRCENKFGWKCYVLYSIYMPSVISSCICKCVGRCVTDNSSGIFICNLWHLHADFWKPVVNHTHKSIIRSLCKRQEVTVTLKWMMKSHISYFTFSLSMKPERKTANLTEEVERHSAHGTLQLKMLGAVKAPLSLAWQSHPSAQSMHMCGSLGELCAPLFSALFISFASFNFEQASCWGCVWRRIRWGSHQGRWQRKVNSRKEPFLNMPLVGVQHPTYVETPGMHRPRSKPKMKMKAKHWDACSLSALSTPWLNIQHLTTVPQCDHHD